MSQFGNTSTGGGLFGASSGGGGGLFGSSAPSTGGGLFGASTSSAPTTGGGLFGATTTPAATNTSGGLFGASSTAPTSTGGGLFGASTTTAAPATSGGLFGASISSAPATSGGLFGASASSAPATSGGLFGSVTTAPASSTSGGLFGASSTTTGTTGGGLFGSQPAGATGLLGQQQQQQQQLSSWQQAALRHEASVTVAKMSQILQTLEEELSSYTYQMESTPAVLHIKQQQPLSDHLHFERGKWEQAKDANPFPDSCFARRLHGFAEVHAHIEQQQKSSAQCLQMVDALSGNIKSLRSNIENVTLKKLKECEARQSQLKIRIVRAITALETLASASGAPKDSTTCEALEMSFKNLQEAVHHQAMLLVRLGSIREAISTLEIQGQVRQLPLNDSTLMPALKVADIQSEEISRLHDALQILDESMIKLEARTLGVGKN